MNILTLKERPIWTTLIIMDVEGTSCAHWEVVVVCCLPGSCWTCYHKLLLFSQTTSLNKLEYRVLKVSALNSDMGLHRQYVTSIIPHQVSFSDVHWLKDVT